MDLDYFQGSVVCMKQEGVSQLMTKKSTRPVAIKDGKCDDSKYKTCGAGTTAKDRATCVKSTQTLCPIVDFANKYTSGYTNTISASNFTWSYAPSSISGTKNKMPINQIKLALYDTTSMKRGECFQDETSQTQYSSSANSYSGALSYPSPCGRVDDRWEVLDSVDESSYLLSNFELRAECTASGVTSDYTASGAQCSSTPNTGDNCAVKGSVPSSFTTCGSSDAICKNVYYQSKCGAFRHVASAGKYKWAVLVRREIYWKDDCEVSMVSIAAAQDDVGGAQTSLGWNMGLNITANFFIGILFPIFFLVNLHYGDVSCIPGEGEVRQGWSLAEGKPTPSGSCVTGLCSCRSHRRRRSSSVRTRNTWASRRTSSSSSPG